MEHFKGYCEYRKTAVLKKANPATLEVNQGGTRRKASLMAKMLFEIEIEIEIKRPLKKCIKRCDRIALKHEFSNFRLKASLFCDKTFQIIIEFAHHMKL